MGGARGRLILLADKQAVLLLVADAERSGARRFKICELLAISIRTLERWEKPDGLKDKRKEAIHHPANKLTQLERAVMLMTANSELYRDLPISKIVPLLADEGRYLASESSFYRVLLEEKQLTHRLTSKAVTHAKPQACIASGPNQVWSWDISYLPSLVQGMYFYLYVVMDIYSRKIVGWSVHEAESTLYAANLIKQCCLDEEVGPDQLVLHSDNGAPMKGVTMLCMLQQLGVVPSFSRPSVSDDNPYSESLFKTLKYHPSFPMIDKFSCIFAARKWCVNFVNWYNTQHLHSALKFVTPAQRHNGQDEVILKNRDGVYQAAKAKHPARWANRQTRNWQLPDEVTLNPNRKKVTVTENKVEHKLAA